MEAARTRRFQRPPMRTVAALAVTGQVDRARSFGIDVEEILYAAAEFFTKRERTIGFQRADRLGLMPRFNSASPTSR